MTTLPLIQSQLEIGTTTSREVLSPPFDIEDAVGSGATYRCKYAEPTIDQIEVVPVREDGVVVAAPRQAAVGKGRIDVCELGVAVG